MGGRWGGRGLAAEGLLDFCLLFFYLYIYIYIERRIKFIRVGDAVRTVGQLKGEPNPFAG